MSAFRPLAAQPSRIVVLALAILLGGAGGAAAELGYLEYSAGLAIMPNQNLVGDDATGAGLSGSVDSKEGYSVGLAVGTDVVEQFGAVLRGEIALGFRNNEVDSMSVQGEPGSATGDLSLFTAMLNAYVDYDLRLPVVPFVGLGVGYGRVELDADNVGSFLKVTDAASVFAWNAMVGGTLAFTTTTDFTMSYRYLATTDPKLEGRLLATGSQRFESEYDVHEIVLGMRVNF